MINGKKTVQMILKMIGEDGQINLDNFTSDFNEDEFIDLNKENAEIFTRQYLDNNKIKTLTDYSGLQARYLNPYLRKGWSYEVLGKIDENKIRQMQDDSEKISVIINELPPLEEKFKCYRGVTLDYFSDYGINSIEDLLSLKGQYFYDAGFTSTSIDRNSSFFGRQILNGQVCNIEITYYIDGGYSDGIFLGMDGISQSPEQLEYLINKGNISKIMDVTIEKNVVYIKAVLIPSKVLNGEMLLEK